MRGVNRKITAVSSRVSVLHAIFFVAHIRHSFSLRTSSRCYLVRHYPFLSPMVGSISASGKACGSASTEIEQDLEN